MTIERTGVTEAKLRWVEPEVLALVIEDTQNVSNRGRDGSIHVDCTRS